jgi:hypothetical protein
VPEQVQVPEQVPERVQAPERVQVPERVACRSAVSEPVSESADDAASIRRSTYLGWCLRRWQLGLLNRRRRMPSRRWQG